MSAGKDDWRARRPTARWCVRATCVTRSGKRSRGRSPKKGAAEFRDRTIELINITGRGLDDEIARLERLAADVKNDTALTTASLKKARKTRAEISSKLAEIDRHPLDDWQRSLVDSAERIGGIVVGTDELFVLEGSLVMRYVADDPLPIPLLSASEPSIRQIRPSPDGFAGLGSEGKVIWFDREGNPLGHTKITQTLRPSIEEPGGGTVTTYSLGLVEADRVTVLDSRQRVGVWNRPAAYDLLWEPAAPQTGERVFEVSADGERLYIGDVGRRRIVPLAHSPRKSDK